MWIVFDQQYRNSYVFAAELFPRMSIPQAWYDAGIAAKADSFAELASKMQVPVDEFSATVTRFNENAFAGEDPDFEQGRSAYDRYYGDPTITPNPNLRPLVKGPFYAVEDGTQRPRYVRRSASRRPCSRTSRRRHRHRRALRNRQTPPPTPSDIPIRARAQPSHRGWSTATSPHATRRADNRGRILAIGGQSAPSASAFFSISYQYAGSGQGSWRLHQLSGSWPPASSRSLISCRVSSRSDA